MATQLAILWCRIRHVPYVLDVGQPPARAAIPLVGHQRLALPRLVPQAAGWLVPGSLARDHIVSYGATPQRTIVFPLTVDVDALGARADALRANRQMARARLGIADDVIAVLQAGRLIEMKAPADLIRDCRRAQADETAASGRPRRRLTRRRAALRALALELDVPVVFTGLLAGEELTAAYVAADVFALVSRRETWAWS